MTTELLVAAALTIGFVKGIIVGMYLMWYYCNQTYFRRKDK